MKDLIKKITTIYKKIIIKTNIEFFLAEKPKALTEKEIELLYKINKEQGSKKMVKVYKKNKASQRKIVKNFNKK